MTPTVCRRGDHHRLTRSMEQFTHQEVKMQVLSSLTQFKPLRLSSAKRKR